MLLISCWSRLMISILLTISAAHLIPAPHSRLSTRDEAYVGIEYDYSMNFSANGYEVFGCGDYRDSASKASRVLDFLAHFKPSLEQLIADAQQGTRSQHGFAAFFKSNRNIRKVVSTLRPLVDAYPVILDEKVARMLGTHTQQPGFHCIDEEAPDPAQKRILDEYCNRSRSLKRPLAIWPGSEVIAICPEFFRLPFYDGVGTGCPTLGADGKFNPHANLISTAYSAAVYALVAVYHRDISDSYQEWGNTFLDMQSSIDDLTVRQSVLKPTNYGFYAAGMLVVWHLFPVGWWADVIVAVQQNCTVFPKTKGRDIELRV
ncbi:MAG: hypothetical protein Q9170_002892 [Blastenia crenularia]